MMVILLIVVVSLFYPFGVVYYRSKLLQIGMSNRDMVSLIGRETTTEHPSDAKYKIDKVHVIQGPIHFILVAGKFVMGMEARCSTALIVRCNNGHVESWKIDFLSNY
jgi:hypothetical protein